jgi:hypothetical protein
LSFLVRSVVTQRILQELLCSEFCRIDKGYQKRRELRFIENVATVCEKFACFRAISEIAILADDVVEAGKRRKAATCTWLFLPNT